MALFAITLHSYRCERLRAEAALDHERIRLDFARVVVAAQCVEEEHRLNESSQQRAEAGEPDPQDSRHPSSWSKGNHAYAPVKLSQNETPRGYVGH